MRKFLSAANGIVGEPNGEPTQADTGQRRATPGDNNSSLLAEQATADDAQRRNERVLQARGHWFEPSCAHQVRGYARRLVRLTESQAKSRTAPRTVTLAPIAAIARRPRPRRALKPLDIALAALRERRAAQAADHLKMGGCAPSNHHRRRDHGPDLSVLSRNLIGVDSPILGGPVLARRAPQRRESERVNVTA
jgi:hypothetical protein